MILIENAGIVAEMAYYSVSKFQCCLGTDACDESTANSYAIEEESVTLRHRSIGKITMEEINELINNYGIYQIGRDANISNSKG